MGKNHVKLYPIGQELTITEEGIEKTYRIIGHNPKISNTHYKDYALIHVQEHYFSKDAIIYKDHDELIEQEETFEIGDCVEVTDYGKVIVIGKQVIDEREVQWRYVGVLLQKGAVFIEPGVIDTKHLIYFNGGKLTQKEQAFKKKQYLKIGQGVKVLSKEEGKEVFAEGIVLGINKFMGFHQIKSIEEFNQRFLLEEPEYMVLVFISQSHNKIEIIPRSRLLIL